MDKLLELPTLQNDTEADALITEIDENMRTLRKIADAHELRIKGLQEKLAKEIKERDELCAPLRQMLTLQVKAVVHYGRKIQQRSEREHHPKNKFQFPEGNTFTSKKIAAKVIVKRMTELIKELKKKKGGENYIVVTERPSLSAIKADWDKISPLKYAHLAEGRTFDIIPSGSPEYIRGQIRGGMITFKIQKDEEG